MQELSQGGRLYLFPSRPKFTICRPLGTSPGDKFRAFLVPDNSLENGTIYEGDVLVIKVGLVRKSGLHVVVTPAGKKRAGFLVDRGGGMVAIEFNSDENEPEVYRRDGLQILGRVVQVYHGGELNEWWELRSLPRAARRRTGSALN